MVYSYRSEVPKYAQSFWLEKENLPSFPPLNKDVAVDVTIIGGRAGGITTAYLLAIQGVKQPLLRPISY